MRNHIIILLMINFIILLNKLLIVKHFVQYVCVVTLCLWCYTIDISGCFTSV